MRVTRMVLTGSMAALILLLSATLVMAQIVINEIDYDQDGTDAAEFLELKNVSANTVDLDGWVVELVNGSGGGAVVYLSIALPAYSLAAGDYYVICANTANTIHCDLDVTPDTNLIQNGAPDGVGLRDPNNILIDAVSYEGDTGAPYTEGSGVGLVDDPAIAYSGISRYPDGVDTNQNNVDFSPRCITPGEANDSLDANCLQPVTTSINSWGAMKARY